MSSLAEFKPDRGVSEGEGAVALIERFRQEVPLSNEAFPMPSAKAEHVAERFLGMRFGQVHSAYEYVRQWEVLDLCQKGSGRAFPTREGVEVFIAFARDYQAEREKVSPNGHVDRNVIVKRLREELAGTAWGEYLKSPKPQEDVGKILFGLNQRLDDVLRGKIPQGFRATKPKEIPHTPPVEGAPANKMPVLNERQRFVVGHVTRTTVQSLYDSTPEDGKPIDLRNLEIPDYVIRVIMYIYFLLASPSRDLPRAVTTNIQFRSACRFVLKSLLNQEETLGVRGNLLQIFEETQWQTLRDPIG